MRRTPARSIALNAEGQGQVRACSHQKERTVQLTLDGSFKVYGACAVLPSLSGGAGREEHGLRAKLAQLLSQTVHCGGLEGELHGHCMRQLEGRSSNSSSGATVQSGVRTSSGSFDLPVVRAGREETSER